jgi:hypothetical protein
VVVVARHGPQGASGHGPQGASGHVVGLSDAGVREEMTAAALARKSKLVHG